MAAKDVVYIYKGLGCKPVCYKMLFEAMKHYLKGSKYSVKTLSPEGIIAGLWVDTAKLLAIGGGFDLGLIKALGHKGMKIIRNYVSAGGGYLGICSGGYFGCEAIAFDKGGPLEVSGPRHLRFFPGMCIGPLFKKFEYDTEASTHAARVIWDVSNTGSATKILVEHYYNGGGYFELSEAAAGSENVTILARYDELLNKPPAVVKCQAGKGTTVLTGVHFEYNPELLNPEDKHLKLIIPSLKKCKAMHERCFLSILHHLGFEGVVFPKL